jgi:hypothetical protein
MLLRTRNLGHDRALELRSRQHPFEGFVGADLDGAGGLHLERSAAYLNWRYQRDPRPISVLSASESAHVAFRAEGAHLAILDVFGPRAGSLLKKLVSEVVAIARSQSVESVVAGISDQHPWRAGLEEIGFRRRESAPFVVYARRGAIEPKRPWFLMSGDRDW